MAVSNLFIRPDKEVSTICKELFCWDSWAVKMSWGNKLFNVCDQRIFRAVSVNWIVIKMDSTKRANELILFKFICIAVNKLDPLVELISGFSVEFRCKQVVSCFLFFKKFVNHVIFHLKQLFLSLKFIQHLSLLCKFSG